MSERILRRLSLERLPRGDRARAAEAIEAETARTRAEEAKRKAALERAVEEHRRGLAGIATPKALRALGAAVRRERAALRALRETPGARRRDFERALRAGSKQLERAARELGIDARGLRALAAARARRVDRAVAPLAESAGRLLPGRPGFGGGRLPIDPPDRTVTPPFPLGVSYHNVDSSEGFSVGCDWEIDEPTGRVATRTWMRCADADWFEDYGSVWVEADLVFVHTAAATGKLSVLVDVTSLESASHIRLEDEFGFSGNHTDLRNFLTLRVYHPATPGVSTVEMGHFSRAGTDADDYLIARYPGSRSYAALESNGTVQEGDTFFVAVGTRSFDLSFTDDVEVTTRGDWSWVFNSIDVGTIPTGPIVTVTRKRAARRRKRRNA